MSEPLQIRGHTFDASDPERLTCPCGAELLRPAGQPETFSGPPACPGELDALLERVSALEDLRVAMDRLVEGLKQMRRQDAAQLERLAAERDTARELARDAVQERDRALSALEEARRERDAARKDASDTQFKWEGTVRALGAALQREKEHIARADALQAEVERLREAVTAQKVFRVEERARADAAWRAGVEAMRETSVCVVSALRGGGSIEHGERFRVVEVLRCLALPPPSATPNEET